LRLPATVRRSSDLHRRSTVQPRLPTCLRLAPPADLRLRLPTQPPTLIVSQTLRPAFPSISGLRLQPIFRPSFPVDLVTFVSDRPSSSAFQSTRDRRHLSIFRPAFRFTSSLRLRPIFRLSFPACVQLAPSANVPALPPNLTSDSHRLLCSPGAALRFICDRRRLQTFRPCLRPQPPTLIVRCIHSAAFRLTCDLRRRFTFQPRLRIQPSTPRLLSPFGAAFRLTCDLRRRSTFQPSLWTQIPTCRLLCSRVVRSG